MSTGFGEAGEPVTASEDAVEQDTPWRRFAPQIIVVWRIRTLVVCTVGLAAVGPLGFASQFPHPFWKRVGTVALGLVLVTVVIAALRLLTLPWRYRLSRWRLEPTFVEIESGWWRTVTERVPVDRVHTMVVSQGPFLRRFALFRTELHASGVSGLLVLSGLTADEVAEVRRHLEFER